MSQNTKATTTGTSLTTILLAAFIFCKLAGVTAIATWSWLWILSPLWLPILGVIAILIVMGFAYVIAKSI